jgi:hypothetical protein
MKKVAKVESAVKAGRPDEANAMVSLSLDSSDDEDTDMADMEEGVGSSMEEGVGSSMGNCMDGGMDEDMARFREELLDWIAKDFDNSVILWKRVNPVAEGGPEYPGAPGTFERWIADTCPENIALDGSNRVRWMDKRVMCDRWHGTFNRLKGDQTLFEVGEQPVSPSKHSRGATIATASRSHARVNARENARASTRARTRARARREKDAAASAAERRAHARQVVLEQLLGLEPEAELSSVRNAIRKQLKRVFASIDVWLLPPPSYGKDALKKEIREWHVEEEFMVQVREMRALMATQLSVPTRLPGQRRVADEDGDSEEDLGDADGAGSVSNNGRVLSFSTLAELMPLAAEAMNDPTSRKVCPQSMFEQLVQRKADDLLAKGTISLLEEGWADFNHGEDESSDLDLDGSLAASTARKPWTTEQIDAHARRVLANAISALEDELTAYMAGADLGR